MTPSYVLAPSQTIVFMELVHTYALGGVAVSSQLLPFPSDLSSCFILVCACEWEWFSPAIPTKITQILKRTKIGQTISAVKRPRGSEGKEGTVSEERASWMKPNMGQQTPQWLWPTWQSEGASPARCLHTRCPWGRPGGKTLWSPASQSPGVQIEGKGLLSKVRLKMGSEAAVRIPPAPASQEGGQAHFRWCWNCRKHSSGLGSDPGSLSCHTWERPFRPTDEFPSILHHTGERSFGSVDKLRR